MRRALVLAACVATALTVPAAAWAHAALLRTVPAASKVVNTPPRSVALVYSEAVEPRFAVVSVTDAAGRSKSTEYDRDGFIVATTDEDGNKTQSTLDARGAIVESKVPHRIDSGTIVYNTTRYEYDEAGNNTRRITPRGVASGTVNTFDFNAISTNFGASTTPLAQEWVNGDFNYDGVINFDDYVIIDVAFNTQSSLGRTGRVSATQPSGSRR